MSLDPFPQLFDKLPLVPKDLVLGHLSPEELVLLGFYAERFIRFVKSNAARRKLSLNCSVRCDPSVLIWVETAEDDESEEEDFKFVIDKGDVETAEKIDSDFDISTIKFTFLTFEECDKAAFRIFQIIGFFNPKLDNIVIDFRTEHVAIQFLESLKETAQSLDLTGDNELSGDTCRRVEKCLAKLKFLKYFTFLLITDELFQFEDCRHILNAEMVSVRETGWLTREDLLLMECEYATFENVILTEEDINAWLLNWQQGSQTHIKTIEFFTGREGSLWQHDDMYMMNEGLRRLMGAPMQPENPVTSDWDMEAIMKDLESTGEHPNRRDIVNRAGKVLTVNAQWSRLKIFDNMPIQF